MFTAIEPYESPGELEEGAGFNTYLTGESGLLAAIIYRAMLDLDSNVPAVHKRSANGWFLSKEKTKPQGFTFLYCCEILNLNSDLIIKKLESSGKLQIEDTEAVKKKRALKKQRSQAPEINVPSFMKR